MATPNFLARFGPRGCALEDLMKDRSKTWLSLGVFALAGTSLTPLPGAEALAAPAGVSSLDRSGAPGLPTAPAMPSLLRLAGGGEGGEVAAGEGGEAGEVPETYALPATDTNAYKYEARDAIAAYAVGVHASYAVAVEEAATLQKAVAALIAEPSDATLAAARKAWVAARPAYLVTETFRFYDGPIEAIEGRINAWPLDEAFIDAVEGAPDSGLINDPKIPISIAAIDERDQVGDENQVTTGWHAIEFLLWGQDLNPDGPGNRPVADYFPGKGNNDRRRQYLGLVTGQLVGDLQRLKAEWASGEADNYAATFLALPPREAIGRIVNGMAVLAAHELMSERLAVGLDSGDQEDEHSCFSDTTHQDFVFDMKGIENVWKGSYPGASDPGIAELVGRVDPGLAREVNGLLADATAKIAKLGDPWDRVLASPPDSPGRRDGEAAVAALGALGKGLKTAGEKLGVLVQIPTE
jgi:putative iron-regulated protein